LLQFIFEIPVVLKARGFQIHLKSFVPSLVQNIGRNKTTIR
jgi:hypothetical protein